MKTLFVLLILISILQVDAKAQEWVYFNTSNSGIPSNYVRHVAIDHDGTVWAGTQNAGLGKLSNGIWTVYNTSNSELPSDNIKKIVVDEDNAVWMIAYGGELMTDLIRFSNGVWDTWELREISDFDVDSAGIVWLIAGFDGEVIRFDGNEFITLDHTNSCLPVFSFSGLLPNRVTVISNNQRWIGMLYNGFDSDDAGVIRMTGDSCDVYTRENSGYPEDGQSTSLIYEDPVADNKVWIVTNVGIVNFDGSVWEELPSHPAGSPSGSFVIVPDGTLWSSNGAIGSCFFQDGDWTVRYGKPDFRIEEFLIDNSNRLWAATETKGLAYLDLDGVSGQKDAVASSSVFKVYPTVSTGKVDVCMSDLLNQGDAYNFILVTPFGQEMIVQTLYPGINTISAQLNHSWLAHYFIEDQAGRIVSSGNLIIGIKE